jgi:NADPH:quinone reductase-like Zn-dependent oxidoreductase
MSAVLLTGYGGYEKLAYREDVAVPAPGKSEVLIRVAAAGINNTDINTRLGWYAKAVTGATSSVAESGPGSIDEATASWSGQALDFPRIQGADCCGTIVAVGEGVPPERIGQRVIVRTMLRSYSGNRPYECWTFGAEVDGGFAQYAIAPAGDTYAVNCGWSDAELASIPCAYSTAENLLHRAQVKAGDTVLITGASGGVGSAAVQLARRRGAEIIAVAAKAKAGMIMALGANRVISRDDDPLETVGARRVDVVIDVVGGAFVPQRVETLRTGGRYAVAGAISGPIATLDLRTVYLRDLSILGCTFQEDVVFADLVSYIERGEIRPLVSKTYPLKAIAEAQQDFLAKDFIGKLVLIPP